MMCGSQNKPLGTNVLCDSDPETVYLCAMLRLSRSLEMHVLFSQVSGEEMECWGWSLRRSWNWLRGRHCRSGFSTN